MKMNATRPTLGDALDLIGQLDQPYILIRAVDLHQTLQGLNVANVGRRLQELRPGETVCVEGTQVAMIERDGKARYLVNGEEGEELPLPLLVRALERAARLHAVLYPLPLEDERAFGIDEYIFDRITAIDNELNAADLTEWERAQTGETAAKGVEMTELGATRL